VQSSGMVQSFPEHLSGVSDPSGGWAIATVRAVQPAPHSHIWICRRAYSGVKFCRLCGSCVELTDDSTTTQTRADIILHDVACSLIKY
jgi:hypothetical protein